jgi:hypothetical protein
MCINSGQLLCGWQEREYYLKVNNMLIGLITIQHPAPWPRLEYVLLKRCVDTVSNLE